MFKLHRHRPGRAEDKIEFKFSHLQVSQVPKGWDKLFISVISVGSGKTIAKTSKALVRHGNCQWPEVFSECKSLPQEHSPKENDDFIFKFVVAMGSARTSILGEAILNLTDHTTPRDAVPVCLPLTVYSEGPILLLKVESITPKTKSWDGKQGRETSSRQDGMNTKAGDVDDKSDESDMVQSRSLGSSSGNRMDMNQSASGSHRSSDSGDSFMGRTKLSPMNSINGAYAQTRRQDSSGSHGSSACVTTDDVSGSTSSPLSAGPNRWQDRNGDPNKVLLEAAQETVEELRGEARLWERKARKLKADLEALRKGHKENFEKRLRDADAERDNLKLENERLRSSMEELQAAEAISRSKFHQEGQIHRHKEMEEELKFLKESNASLSLHLKKTQESNIELVSILQELEETIEKQRLEGASFSDRMSSGDKRSSEDDSHALEDPWHVVNDSDLKREIDGLKAKIQELERECAELTEENLGLMIKLKEPKKDVIKNEVSLGCTPQIFLDKFSSSDPGLGIFQHMNRAHQEGEKSVDKDAGAGALTELSTSSHFKELEQKCADLELELQEFKDTASILAENLCESQKEVEKKSLELSDTRKMMEEWQQQDGFAGRSTLLKDDQTSKLAEYLGIALIDCDISYKCLEDMNKEVDALTARLNSQVSTNKLLERKSQELEESKHELELHITGLEEENIGLSERISGLEAQLRYLTNAKESSKFELESSRNQVMELKEELQKLSAGMEEQKGDLQEKLLATQQRLSEAVNESEYLKRSHSKLDATTESLVEECSSLQKLISDLKRQKQELHQRSTLLEFQLKEAEEKNADFDSKIEAFEEKISALQNDVSLKERSLRSEAEAMLKKQKEQEDKLRQANDLLSRVELDKEAEVERLKREVAGLTAQLSLKDDDGVSVASDAVELSQLQADKMKLENSLQEAQSKVKSYETQMENVRQDLGSNIQSMIGLLNASKESEDMLMADIGRMKRQMEKMKSGEEKVKKLANELELKLKSSEYEKEQLAEEVSILKVQQTKIAQLQEQVTALKSSLQETSFAKTKLEESLELLSEEREKLKAENSSCKERISAVQKTLPDMEGDRQSRIALEEKLLRLECDLKAKEALHAQEIELKNELSRMRMTNSQHQRKIKCIEEERDELARKVQVLEMDLRPKKRENEDEGYNMERSHNASVEELHEKVRSLQTELSKALETNSVYKEQLSGLLAEKRADDPNASSTWTTEEAVTGGGRADRLEIELKEMRERYLQMSLRYAEVEAQREDLVMKLKSTKKEKKWFT